MFFVNLGMCVEVKESYMNALSAVSGCGLAFLFLAIEAMSDGGVKVGLPRALSMDLVTQTLIGAARLVQETGKHPGQVHVGQNTVFNAVVLILDILNKANTHNKSTGTC